MLRVDEAHLTHASVEQDGVRPHAAREEADALQQLAVSDAGRDEADVFAAREILGAVDLLLVADAHLLRPLPRGLTVYVASPQSAPFVMV